MKDKKQKIPLKDVKEIVVVDEVVMQCAGLKLCYPGAFFERVEQCKLCGKCV